NDDDELPADREPDDSNNVKSESEDFEYGDYSSSMFDEDDDDDDDDDDKPFPGGMSPETPYESRFFIVALSQSGEIVKADFSKILSVDASSVSEYTEKALNRKDEKGFIDQFRFSKKTKKGQTYILFLDCGRKLDAFTAFLKTSAGVGIGGCVIVFVAFLFLSGRIVKPIAESYEKQKRFISDAGHEMKTPLTIINANLDLLETDEADERNEELEDIRAQTKRMTELTNNLVYLSKMEEAEHKAAKAEMPLSDVASETVNSFRTLASARKVNFSAEITPGIALYGAPDEIRRLISILLENAMKYASADEGKVTINLSANKKSAVLSVFNTTDVEIRKADLPFVFDRFYRADASRNSSTGGHGIGLSIAKAIVNSHGGAIKAETESGKDFRITATLPFKN
ncbi:MAG: HAMP domain-containing histidine kinase, partial [Clostridiales bacterium]|nr:HAMP domain-containing histidine kinase [Clostridiales bacterium]